MNEFQPQLALIKIPVSDIEKSVAYYRDAMGLAKSFSVPEYGWAQLQLGKLPFCLYVLGKGSGGSTPTSAMTSIFPWLMRLPVTRHLSSAGQLFRAAWKPAPTV